MKTARTLAKSDQWLWSAAIWSAVGLFDATQTVFLMRSEGMHHAWGRLFFTSMFEWLPWALATPLVLELGRRYPPIRLKPVSTWVRHLAACLTIDLTFALWSATLEKLLNPFAAPQASATLRKIATEKFYGGLLASVILYTAI